MTIIHILHSGFALCGKPFVPGAWKDGHKWVRVADAHQATCAACIDRTCPEPRQYEAPTTTATAGMPVEAYLAYQAAAESTIEVLKRSLSRASDIIQLQEADAHRDHATITAIKVGIVSAERHHATIVALKLALEQCAFLFLDAVRDLENARGKADVEARTAIARFLGMTSEDWEALP